MQLYYVKSKPVIYISKTEKTYLKRYRESNLLKFLVFHQMENWRHEQHLFKQEFNVNVLFKYLDGC